MQWNLADIALLHQPDIFTGTFDNAKMQARHEVMALEKRASIQFHLEQEDDPLKALALLSERDQLTFLDNNRAAFRHRGQYEAAVLALYGRQNAPFQSGGDQARWIELLNACSVEVLRSLGEPLPFQQATVFRGSVTGLQRGLTWTPDRARACFFADRWGDATTGAGNIYQVEVQAANVLLYRVLRRDQEVILSPAFVATARIRPFLS
jgi:hypothetical protein